MAVLVLGVGVLSHQGLVQTPVGGAPTVSTGIGESETLGTPTVNTGTVSATSQPPVRPSDQARDAQVKAQLEAMIARVPLPADAVRLPRAPIASLDRPTLQSGAGTGARQSSFWSVPGTAKTVSDALARLRPQGLSDAFTADTETAGQGVDVRQVGWSGRATELLYDPQVVVSIVDLPSDGGTNRSGLRVDASAWPRPARPEDTFVAGAAALRIEEVPLHPVDSTADLKLLAWHNFPSGDVTDPKEIADVARVFDAQFAVPVGYTMPCSSPPAGTTVPRLTFSVGAHRIVAQLLPCPESWQLTVDGRVSQVLVELTDAFVSRLALAKVAP